MSGRCLKTARLRSLRQREDSPLAARTHALLSTALAAGDSAPTLPARLADVHEAATAAPALAPSFARHRRAVCIARGGHLRSAARACKASRKAGARGSTSATRTSNRPRSPYSGRGFAFEHVFVARCPRSTLRSQGRSPFFLWPAWEPRLAAVVGEPNAEPGSTLQHGYSMSSQLASR
jgi:hypothetical protein